MDKDKLKNAIAAFRDIDTARDLKHAKLSLADYEILGYVLEEVVATGAGSVVQESVANWCQRQGLSVTQFGTGFLVLSDFEKNGKVE